MNSPDVFDCLYGMEISKTPVAILFCDAIENRKRVTFIYHGKERAGEPQCCGISHAGNEVVRVHLTKGGSRPEQLFEIAQVKSLKLLNEHFTKPGPNYRRDDSAMKIIYCQL
jgi:hypothetical protein